MQLAMIGLGRMGRNMAERLMKNNHSVVVYDQSASARKTLVDMGAIESESILSIKNHLRGPRVIWMMVPHDVVDNVINELVPHLDHGDIVIDGGNSHFLSSIERNKNLLGKGLHFVDVGVSGGVFGLERGYCLMVGGEQKICEYLEPIFSALAPGEDAAIKTKSRKQTHTTAHKGYFHCGPAGAGHYVKMIHNAIEYGMMQSYAEGLEILKNASSANLSSEQHFDFDVAEICELWRRGSVINSWLLDLVADALAKDPHLDGFTGNVPDSGEGRWALFEAIKQGTPSPNLASALFTRFRSRAQTTFAEKTLSALRKEFGGHSEVHS